VGQEFGESFGRSYASMFWENRLDDADVVIVAMGSLATEAIAAADRLREAGHKVGVLGLRVFRPFPKAELAKALEKSRLVVIFDKNISYGLEGATCSEIKSALYGSSSRAIIRNFIVGLGGRDVKAREMVDVVNRSLLSVNEGSPNREYPEWICAI
jgi:pyruvate/2-oxoacid:ferredoxin oxidoreductase alpha subunit